MKKSLNFVPALLFLLTLFFIYSCQKDMSTPTQPENSSNSLNKKGGTGDCVTIQSGSLLTSDGEVITPGYDKWGYNYQAHIFNGYYCDAYRNASWCQDYKDVKLEMKWNDAWLSNKDCDGDGLLDRHYSYTSYIGSGAWITNHMAGTYINDKGKKSTWNYFVKIAAAPSDAYNENGYWYTFDGKEIGPVIWGEFAVIQEVYNDPSTGEHGVSYLSPVGPGFGKF